MSAIEPETEMKKSIPELLEEISAATTRANEDEARSALVYCLKQLKISAAAEMQN